MSKATVPPGAETMKRLKSKISYQADFRHSKLRWPKVTLTRRARGSCPSKTARV